MITQLKNEADSLSRTIKEKDRAIIQLRRELIDVDTQLDSERRKRAAMRLALEKDSTISKKTPSERSAAKSPADRTPTSFRLSTRSPPVSPSPYKDGKVQNPQPAQTPEVLSALESRSKGHSRPDSAPHSRGRPKSSESSSSRVTDSRQLLPTMTSPSPNSQPPTQGRESRSSRIHDAPLGRHSAPAIPAWDLPTR